LRIGHSGQSRKEAMAFYKTMVAITIVVAAAMWGLLAKATFGWIIVGLPSVIIAYAIVGTVLSNVERD
jgi:hypothetical protein